MGNAIPLATGKVQRWAPLALLELPAAVVFAAAETEEAPLPWSLLDEERECEVDGECEAEEAMDDVEKPFGPSLFRTNATTILKFVPHFVVALPRLSGDAEAMGLVERHQRAQGLRTGGLPEMSEVVPEA